MLRLNMAKPCSVAIHMSNNIINDCVELSMKTASGKQIEPMQSGKPGRPPILVNPSNHKEKGPFQVPKLAMKINMGDCVLNHSIKYRERNGFEWKIDVLLQAALEQNLSNDINLDAAGKI